MIDTSDPTVAALLAACVKNPDELDCALRLADRLQEQGDEARAEFIRVQCELERLRHDNDEETHRINRLTRRAGDLLRDHERAWRSAGPCPGCGGNGPGWATKNCAACFWSGDVGGLLVMPPAVLRDEGDDLPAIRYSHPVRWRRGLIDRVEVPRLEECFERGLVGCPECERLNRQRGPGGAAFRRCGRCDGGAVQVWRPTPWLRAVVTHHPTVCEVVPLCREPFEFDRGRWVWAQTDEGEMPAPYTVPAVLWFGEVTDGVFDTREAAVSALGRAVVAVARGN